MGDPYFRFRIPCQTSSEDWVGDLSIIVATLGRSQAAWGG